MTLNEVMKETADAIREKKGTTDKIAPINFAEEIKSISVGGGDAPSGDSLQYFDIRAEEFRNLIEIAVAAQVVYSVLDDNTVLYGPPGMIGINKDETLMGVRAFGIDPTTKFIKFTPSSVGNMVTSVEEMFGFYLEKAPRITKEQFYNLDA